MVFFIHKFAEHYCKNVPEFILRSYFLVSVYLKLSQGDAETLRRRKRHTL